MHCISLFFGYRFDEKMEGKENTVSGNVGHTPSIAAKQSGILRTPVTRSGLIPTRRVSSGGSGLAQKSTTPLGGTPSRAAALDSPRLAARSVPCSLCIAAEDALAEVHGRQTELEADLAAKQMEILDLKRRASLLEMELRAAETKTEQAREERARIASILDLSGGLARLDVGGEDTPADSADQQLRNAVRAAAVRFGLDSEDPLAALRSLTEVTASF
jgi:chromosome segregation ATPase